MYSVCCLRGVIINDSLAIRIRKITDLFGHSIIVPLVKDRSDDISKLTNYRGISLSSVISKVFEYCLIDKCGNYWYSYDLQFGLKKHTGCANATYTVQQVSNYYTERGSTVYMTALDASKAFDRVNHNIN